MGVLPSLGVLWTSGKVNRGHTGIPGHCSHRIIVGINQSTIPDNDFIVKTGFQSCEMSFDTLYCGKDTLQSLGPFQKVTGDYGGRI